MPILLTSIRAKRLSFMMGESFTIGSRFSENSVNVRNSSLLVSNFEKRVRKEMPFEVIASLILETTSNAF